MSQAKPCLCAAFLLLSATFACAQAGIEHPNFIEPDPEPDAHRPSLQACPTTLHDGDIVFIRAGKSIYAVKILAQFNFIPEQAAYAYLKIGTDSPVVITKTRRAFPGGFRLDGVVVPWSIKTLGEGFIYLTASHGGLPPDYEIGLPFYHGEVETFRKAVPPGVTFQSLPDTGWRNVMAR
jgi:hypothetical protein